METYAQSSNLNWYRGFIQGKTRITMAWVFVFILAFSARDYPHWEGIAVCFLGASLRFWASGYLRKDSRPAVGGPYSFVRNPLYLGTYIMTLGVLWSIQNWMMLLISSVLFAAVYHYIILDEEAKLRRIFGESYLKYCRKVSRFWPRPWPIGKSTKEVLEQINPDLSYHRFSFELAMKNKAYEAYAAFLGLIALEVIAAFLWHSVGQ